MEFYVLEGVVQLELLMSDGILKKRLLLEVLGGDRSLQRVVSPTKSLNWMWVSSQCAVALPSPSWNELTNQITPKIYNVPVKELKVWAKLKWIWLSTRAADCESISSPKAIHANELKWYFMQSMLKID